jgi:UDP-2,3-diacylglucosamine hydrolase
VAASPAVPTFEEWRANASLQTVDFISDLHLGDDTPRGFDAWARYMRSTPADAVVILGDLFEVWVGDDARLSGFGARCAEVLTAAAAVRQVAFMVGNRDFLVGPAMLAACGVQSLADPTVLVLGAERVLLSHGDMLCLDDTDYQQFRSMVHSPAWQRDFLALPLAERRLRAQQMREQSRLHQKTRPNAGISDLDLPTTVQWMRAAATPTFVHGHTHRPATQVLAPGLVRHVLSDWDLDHATVERAEVLRWQRNSWNRLPLQP